MVESILKKRIDWHILELLKMRRVGLKQLVVFTKQLSTLVRAGLPLVKSLHTLHEQIEPGPLKEIVGHLAKDVETGSAFSEALAHYPAVFPSIFASMVKAGELGGMLDEILARLSEFLEKQHKLRQRVKSALVYPAFVLCIALTILIILMVFVVPTFINMFTEVGGVLPLPTRLLIATSDLLRHRWYVLGVFLAVIILSYKLVMKSPIWRFKVDRLKLKLPIVGVLILNVAVARFARTLGTLIKSGVPILGALLTVRDIVGNEFVKDAVMKVHNSVKEGEGVAGPLQEGKVFPPLLVKMVAIGEETGALDNMLIQIADNYEEEVDVAVGGLTALLEPILIVSMGLAVGFIVIAMFLPLFTLAKLVG